MTVAGAQRKHPISPTDFRSPPQSGHSHYDHPMARFAPERTLVRLAIKVGTGWTPVLGRLPRGRHEGANIRKMNEHREAGMSIDKALASMKRGRSNAEITCAETSSKNGCLIRAI